MIQLGHPTRNWCTMLMRIFLVMSGVGAGLVEHKVHNIILYPEKHSWCQTTPIQQVVASPGYEPVTIDNHICVGACYSYSIPSTQPAEPGELIGPYCDSCQPVETKCYHVNLHADGKNTEGPKTFQKRVQIIMKCSCMSCEKMRQDCDVGCQHTLELPQDLFSNHSQEASGEETPELLNFSPAKHHHNITVKELRKAAEGSRDDHLMKLLEIANSGDADEDSGKLKDVVVAFNSNEDFGLSLGQQNNEEVERDLKKYDLPPSFGLEGAAPGQDGAAKVKHHLGDEVHVGLNVEHLIKGPHGSMVLAPIEQKLDIDSDVLKPNHDGVVIAYENHSKNRLNDILTN